MNDRERTSDPQDGGAKRERPRDELGRPLPWGEASRLEMEDFDAHSQEENHRLGVVHFNAGRYFQAHEAWETAWKQGKGTSDEEFFKGLSQLGAGYVHVRRGNTHGAHTLMRRGMSRVRRYGPAHLEVDVEALDRTVEEHARRMEAANRAGEPPPQIEPPTI